MYNYVQEANHTPCGKMTLMPSDTYAERGRPDSHRAKKSHGTVETRAKSALPVEYYYR